MTIALVAVGASWGGLHAVSRLLADIPGELPACVAIAQHRGTEGNSGLAELLSRHTAMPVEDAEDKTPLRPGHVVLAPPDYHLLVEGDHFALTTDAPVSFARPSIDVLFESAAYSLGERVAGVVLTGANDDGAAGLRRIKDAGGVAVVQDPRSAERPEMPRAAVAAVAHADAVLPLEEIGKFLYGLCCEPAPRGVPA